MCPKNGEQNFSATLPIPWSVGCRQALQHIERLSKPGTARGAPAGPTLALRGRRVGAFPQALLSRFSHLLQSLQPTAHLLEDAIQCGALLRGVRVDVEAGVDTVTKCSCGLLLQAREQFLGRLVPWRLRLSLLLQALQYYSTPLLRTELVLPSERVRR